MENMVSTNRMITEVDRKYGVHSNEVTLMRLYVISYKARGVRTYEDCYRLYEKLIKGVDK